MAAEVSEPKAKAESCILGFLNTNDEISDSDEFAESNGINRGDLESVIRSLSGFQFVDSKEIKKEQWLLTEEGKLYADEGSPEAKVFSAVPPEGILRADLEWARSHIKASAFSREGACYKSLADSLGDDEFDNVVPPILNSQGEEELSDTVYLENIQKMRQREHKRINILTDKMDGDKSEGISSKLGIKQISRRRKGSIFDAVQEIAIRQLYEKYKDDRHCSRLIAKALDPE